MPTNRITRALLAGTASALLLTGSAAVLPTDGAFGLVRPAEAASLRISVFFDALAPHGTWVDHHRYGYVFVPAVEAGWRPYVHGHWVYTKRHGWYWVSDEPFAWAVYHYGRWAYDRDYGWIWVPGNVWAPAWVTWRHGGDHIGWAPIGPHHHGYVYGTPDYYEPAIVEAWVFVPARRFVAVDIAQHVVPVVEINVVLGRTRERDHVHYRDGVVVNTFLPLDRARQIVNQDIDVVNVTVVNDPSEASRQGQAGDGEIKAFQAEISEEQPEEKPKTVAKSPDEVKTKPKLRETAKGERPDDAPPSAAKLESGDAPDGAKTADQPARETPEAEKAAGEQKTPDTAEKAAGEQKAPDAADKAAGPDDATRKSPEQAESKPAPVPGTDETPDRAAREPAKDEKAPAAAGRSEDKADREKRQARPDKDGEPKATGRRDRSEKPKAEAVPQAPAERRADPAPGGTPDAPQVQERAAERQGPPLQGADRRPDGPRGSGPQTRLPDSPQAPEAPAPQPPAAAAPQPSPGDGAPRAQGPAVPGTQSN